jgi:hypothetical protein
MLRARPSRARSGCPTARSVPIGTRLLAPGRATCRYARRPSEPRPPSPCPRPSADGRWLASPSRSAGNRVVVRNGYRLPRGRLSDADFVGALPALVIKEVQVGVAFVQEAPLARLEAIRAKPVHWFDAAHRLFWYVGIRPGADALKLIAILLGVPRRRVRFALRQPLRESGGIPEVPAPFGSPLVSPLFWSGLGAPLHIRRPGGFRHLHGR